MAFHRFFIVSAQKKKTDKARFKDIRNAKALRDFAVEERFEAGIVLRGTEIKSIRAGKAQINDAFARVERGEVFLYNAHIDEYVFGNVNNHEPTRVRKLLLHKKEIRSVEQSLKAGGYTLIPLRMYFKGSLAKLEIGLAKGKKLYDKREDLKKKVQTREMDRAMAARR